MKKIKFGIFSLVLACTTLLLTACNLFGPSLKKFEVQYTSDLQLLVGEEWSDDLIKGTAFYSDDTKKDVTKDMKIDTSNYNKSKAGKYDIEFSYKDSNVSYEVEVVDKITDSNNINYRLEKVLEKTFKRTNNQLSFEATKTSVVSNTEFVESLIYIEKNGQISAYTKWVLDSETVLEMHYNGTKDSGVETSVFSSENETIEYENWSLDQYSAHLLLVGQTLVLPAEITPSGILSLTDVIFDGELTLENNVYTLVSTDNKLEYKNNVLTTINEIELKVPKRSDTTIPEFTSIQKYMNNVIENTYVRKNGQLQIMAQDNKTLTNGINIRQNFVIQENNGEYLIYNKFTTTNNTNVMTLEYWFSGTLYNGTITVKSNNNFGVENNKDLDYFMNTIYSFQEELNKNNIDYTIALFPSNLIYLENSEFYGDLTLIDEQMGSLEQEISEDVVFTLNFMDNKIISVNDVTVVFSDTITDSYIPSIPNA